MPPCFTWDDIVPPADLIAQPRELAAEGGTPSPRYETWRSGAKLCRGRGIAALFAGTSGAGKTMTAEVLARYLDLALCRIDRSNLVSEYIGETERNLRQQRNRQSLAAD